MRPLFIAFLLVTVLTGCTSSPPGPNPSVVEREIIKNALKELCAAVLNVQGLYARGNPSARGQHLSPNDGWIAGIETSLRTDLEGAVNPSATLIGPIIPGLIVPKGGTAGSYNAAIGGTIDQTATTTRDNKHYLVINALMADSELCPPPGTPVYTAYYNEGAPYRGDGKYLEGKLGIREWLYNGVFAQNFNALINPSTQILQGAPVPEPAFGALAPELAPPPPCPDCPVAKHPQVTLSVTQGAINKPVPLGPFFKDPHNLRLTYSITKPPAVPNWIQLSGDNLILGPVPTGTLPDVEVTAKNTKNLISTPGVTFTLNTYPAPKVTTWGPVYGATFTFIIKASGQLGPTLTLDRAKGGAANLFSVTRTETNFVNIALTAVGVPLEEYNPTTGITTTGANVDAVNAAIRRIDDQLLRLDLLNVNNILLLP